MLFADVIGQEALKQQLIQSVAENRVSHAQLFLGAAGSGKFALALAYAQYINCKSRSATDSCGVCPSCVKISKLTHPDLHFVFPTTTNKKVKKDAESRLFMEEWRQFVLEQQAYIGLNDWFSFIGVENKQGTIYVRDANEIIRKLGFKAYEGEYKVMIIWMAEKINLQAANKLLKLLEEPPDKTLFILVAEEQDQILATVRSRSYMVKIPRIADEAVIDALSSKYNIRRADAQSAALIAHGNWLEAQRLYENAEDEKYNFQTFQQWMRLCYRGVYGELLDFTASLSRIGREKQKSFLNYALQVFRNGLLINNQLDRLVRTAEEERDFNRKFSAFVNHQNAMPMVKLMEDGIQHIERNAHAGILFADISFKMVKLLKVKVKDQ
jgi:DNA polymerase III subunit delta'